jgi:SAM-dependent methyltransferase
MPKANVAVDPASVGGLRSSEWVQRLKRLAPGGVCYDPWSDKRIRRFLEDCGPDARIVDVGSGTRVLDARILRLDIDQRAGVHVIGDGHEMPFRSDSLDAVVLTGVLEHVADPPAMVAQVLRVLKPAGRVYVEVPFLQGYHPHPTDYQRYTKTGLQRLMRDFRELDCNVCGGPSSALAWVASEYLAAHTSTERGYLVAKFLGRWLAFWIKYLDWFSIGRPNALVLASGFYYIGEKR